jgi:hypothetical protein
MRILAIFSIGANFSASADCRGKSFSEEGFDYVFSIVCAVFWGFPFSARLRAGGLIMTKKDYVAIAAVIQDVRSLPDVQSCLVARATTRTMIVAFADVFADDNDRFDRLRFLRACGL